MNEEFPQQNPDELPPDQQQVEQPAFEIASDQLPATEPQHIEVTNEPAQELGHSNDNGETKEQPSPVSLGDDIDRAHAQALASSAIHENEVETRGKISKLETLRDDSRDWSLDRADIKSRASDLGVELNPNKGQTTWEIEDFIRLKREEVKVLRDLAHKAEEWAVILYDGAIKIDLDNDDYYNLLGYSREDGSGIFVDSLGGNVHQVKEKALEHLLDPVTLARREQYLEHRKSVIERVKARLRIESEHTSYDEILRALPGNLSPIDPSGEIVESLYMLDQNGTSAFMDASEDYGYKSHQLKRGVAQNYNQRLSEDDENRFQLLANVRDKYGLVSLYEALGTPARPYDNANAKAKAEVRNAYIENGKELDPIRSGEGRDLMDNSITYGQLKRIYKALVAERLLVDFEGYDKAIDSLNKLKGQSSNADS